MVRKPDGHPWSIASWAQDVSAAIPEVDEIVLVRADQAAVGVPWARLHESVGDLIEPIGGLPLRYLTHGFPSDEMVHNALD